MECELNDVRLGANCWNQYTDWPSMREAGVRADRLGYYSLWTWDHLYPIVGSHEGPILEGWMTLAGWAAATERVRIGLMVGANTFREPALTAKLATMLDLLSAGRAILGIGAAWFRRSTTRSASSSATARRSASGGSARPSRSCAGCSTARSRRRRARGTGPRPSATTRRRSRTRLPILVGGGGEQVTLKLVAKYADANNVGGGVETVRRRRTSCSGTARRSGRDPSEIERTTGIGTVFIRDSAAEAQRVFERTFEENGGAKLWEAQPVGTPEQVAEMLAPYPEIGYRHLIAGFPAPHDEESMTRLATEVLPLLQKG